MLASRLIALAVAVLGTTAAFAQTAELEFQMHAAHAEVKDDDNCPTCTPQDFYVQVQFAGGPVQQSPQLDGRDDAAFGPWIARATVSKLQRYHELTLTLLDDDDSSGDETFDINPDATRYNLQMRFDACTNRFTALGVSGRFGPGVVATPAGDGFPQPPLDNSDDRATVNFKLHTTDDLPFTTRDVAIVGLDAVQATFDPERIISSKPTAMRVTLASTYPTTVTNIPLTVNVSDGINSWQETTLVDVAPGVATAFYLFDGMNGHQSPFVPVKPINVDRANLTFSASIAVVEHAPPGTPAEFADCYQANNSLTGASRPIVRTKNPFVVYAPFEYLTDFDIPSGSSVEAYRVQEETFRQAAWPLASTAGSITSPIPAIGIYTGPWDPYTTIFAHSVVANLLQIDRLVLVPSNGWFATHNILHPGVKSGTIGLSMGEIAPHAVIAELGRYAVANHELGHTYKLSRRKCSTGGIWESLLNLGCRDEYKFAPSDGAPFVAKGLDVTGSVYPTGITDVDLTGCPASVPAGTREICVKNLMDSSGKDGLFNWLDNETYDEMTRALGGNDPELITISGWVESPGWYLPNPNAPVFNGTLQFGYHADGVPDLLAPAPGHTTSGTGSFALRMESSTGLTQTFRFNPSFGAEEGGDTPLDRGFFAFTVPWDPSTTTMTLLGPSDIRAGECELAPCASQDVTLSQRFKSAGSPSVGTMRAGKDIAPSFVGAPPPPPTIGPGHNAVIAWNPSDPDFSELHSTLVLSPLDAFGSAEQFMPIVIDQLGTTASIPHSQLTDRPGLYVGRVFVSDGVNSTRFDSATLFNICNHTNSGVEICNGIDDDCDGFIDNVVAPPGSIGVSVDKTVLSWTQIAAAQSHDVLRGDVGLLLSSNGNFTPATQQCLASQTTATTLPFTSTPPAGNAWWFLVRARNCQFAGTYNEGNNSQTATRDPGIAASPAACP